MPDHANDPLWWVEGAYRWLEIALHDKCEMDGNDLWRMTMRDGSIYLRRERGIGRFCAVGLRVRAAHGHIHCWHQLRALRALAKWNMELLKKTDR